MLNQSVIGTAVAVTATINLSSKAGLTKNQHTIQIDTDVTGTGTFEIWARVLGAGLSQKLTSSFNAANLSPIVIDGVFDQIQIVPNTIATATTYDVFISSRA